MKRLLLVIGLAFVLPSLAAAQEIRFAWSDHPSLRAGKWLRVDLRARVQEDVRRSQAATDDEGDGALDAARKRVGIEGHVAHIVEYQAEYEIGAREWRDLYVDYAQFKAVQIRAGKFKLPFGLDETTSVTNLDFIYRARISSRLAPGRDRGVTLHGRVFSGVVAYEAGVFRNDGDNARPSNSARVFGNRTTAARVTVQPFRGSKSVMADFQAGMAVSGTTVPEGFPAVRARTVLGTSFFDSNVWVKGRRQRTGLEARWRPGPFSIQAEYIRLTDQRRGEAVDDGDLSPLLAHGWYVSGTYAVTGGRKATGLDRPRRRLGAVEVATRLERLSFGSTGANGDPSTSRRADRVLGNSDLALTCGINWYLNRWVKIQANLIREWIAIRSMGPLPDRSNFWSRALRFQLMV